MRYYPIILIFIILITGCKTSDTTISSLITDRRNSLLDSRSWYHKDYLQDRIAGISLDKWYRLDKIKLKNTDVIVAVIDTQIDLKHG